MQPSQVQHTTFEIETPTTLHDTNFSYGCHLHVKRNVEVYLQVFRGLPIKLRVQCEGGQRNRPLPERFQQAARQVIAQIGEPSEREISWILYGYRHGGLEEVAEAVIEEISRTIDDFAILRWQRNALRLRDDAALQSALPSETFHRWSFFSFDHAAPHTTMSFDIAHSCAPAAGLCGFFAPPSQEEYKN